jgi:alanyl-tRNA synthetase
MMKTLTSAEIRQLWLEFFASKGHAIAPSKSLVPVDDPSLLWINSGVATLKKYFDGSVKPENPRIVNSQKSIRTNDIENVGKTARHHTLFEMLGNFSIGDYFKEEAITWAWEFLTDEKWLAIPEELLYVTVHPDDDEARKIWHEKVGLAQERIIDIPKNFWDIGEGPSGPNSEIFVDRGVAFQDLPDDDPEMFPGGENERYLEIWNLVFSQYNHLPGLTDPKDYPELPHKNIDTGAGLERITSFFQNAKTNFETDLFLPIIQATEQLATVKYGDAEQTDVSFKVIADHIRAITFAIGDGALPSNEGRGYVIRRLLRRAVLHGQNLGIEGQFLTDLVPVVGEIMASYYPEVQANAAKIQKTVAAEEKRFGETLAGGLSLLQDVIAQTKARGDHEINGQDAFKLYDTYGFPLELTDEKAQEAGLGVDKAGFDAEMQAQRERARAARGNDKSMGAQSAVLTDLSVQSTYVGWTDTTVAQAKIVALIADDRLQERVSAEQNVQIVFDVTPFYAEMGGQVADYGTITNGVGEIVGQVIDVQKGPNGQHIHTVTTNANLHVNEVVGLAVDMVRHNAVSKNHTATHMLDQALRNLIGGDVHQAGSFVGADTLRFDFNHEGPVPAETLAAIETLINDKIAENLPVSWVETDLETAQKMGAVAVFGEKYGETVRVVSIGDFNKEFDGGTHANSTAELGLFKITSETGTGAGIRRIEAVTGQTAFKLLNDRANLVVDLASRLKVQHVEDVPAKVISLQEELKATQRQNESLEAKLAAQAANDVFKDSQTVNGITYITAQLQVSGMDALRQVVDNWKQSTPSDVLVLAAANDGKVNLIVAASQTANEQGVKAGDLIKAIAPHIGGGGGGRPDMAQAGGKNPAGIQSAFDAVATFLQDK